MSAIDNDALALSGVTVSLEAKIAGLRALVAECLGRHDAAYLEEGRVASHLDDLVIDAASRRERHALMGEPARYAEVIYARRGAPAPGQTGATGEGFGVSHAFELYLYFGVPSRQGPGAADTAAFRQLVESDDPGTPGLAYLLGVQRYVPTAEGPADVVGPVAVTDIRPVALSDNSGRADWRHEARLTLTLDG